MRYVVAYDVGDDDVRHQIAKVLAGFGWRVQRSVFECEVAETDLDSFVERLQAALDPPDAGGIRIYRLCVDCQRLARGIGVQPVLTGDDEAVVL